MDNQVIRTYYVLQDAVTEKFVGVDSSAGGYPYLTEAINAHQFYSVGAANELLNGGKNNCAYKTSFPKECGNTILRTINVILK